MIELANRLTYHLTIAECRLCKGGKGATGNVKILSKNARVISF